MASQLKDVLPLVDELERTLEIAKRNRYSLSGRTYYAKKARLQIASVKREIDSACKALESWKCKEQAVKLAAEISTVGEASASVDDKLRALESLRFLWLSEITTVQPLSVPQTADAANNGGLFLPPEGFGECPNPIQRVVKEINISVASGCSNAASMLLRRLGEMLIIFGYELANRGKDVRNEKGYAPLSGLVDSAESGQLFALGSAAKRGLRDIKSFGDGAAHSRFFLVNDDDLARIRPAVRVCFDELVGRCCELREILRKQTSPTA